MVPESLATVYAFLGLVAPGLVYQFVRERAQPSLEESPFREASRVALTSLVFTALSILILAAVGMRMPGAVVDLAAWFGSGADYLSANLWLIVWSVLLEVGLACGLAWFATFAMKNWFDKRKVTHAKSSIWYLTILESEPTGQAAWLSVELKDGTKVWGYVHYFSTSLAMADRELSLKGPGLAMQRDGCEQKSVTADYFVLPGSDIRWIKVTFEPAAKTDRGPKSEVAEGAKEAVEAKAHV